MSTTGARPRVAVIGTGGTIATRSPHGPLDLVDYMAGTTLDARALVEAVPELASFAEVVPVNFRAVSSTAIGFAEWKALVLECERAVAEHRADGIVVTHGTATLEETAYLLHLAVKVDVPVVLTGSQRPLGAISSDAPGNLVNAVRMAADPQARGLGVLVCLNDEVHGAREVTKSYTARLHTFRSADAGPLGQVDGDRVSFYRRPLRRGAPDTGFDIRPLDNLPRVDIAYSYAGEDGGVVRALVDAGARGLVVAAFAGGRLSRATTAACREAVERGVPVVLSTRAGAGRAMVARDLLELGFIPADNLNPQKARILLALGLAHGAAGADLAKLFDTY
ncbi:MAG TPA: asparaginase [Ramlibacter sp.]|nr:asparaginase [Ramlibacter sp.]